MRGEPQTGTVADKNIAALLRKEINAFLQEGAIIGSGKAHVFVVRVSRRTGEETGHFFGGASAQFVQEVVQRKNIVLFVAETVKFCDVVDTSALKTLRQ